MDTLNILTSELFDYAGMYPPAKLSFEAMLKESAELPKSLHRPQLCASRFVIPVALLNKLSDSALKAAGFNAGEKLPISLLSNIDNLVADILTIKHYFSTSNTRKYQLSLRSFEFPLTREQDIKKENVTKFVQELKAINQKVKVYLELRANADWSAQFEKILALCRIYNSKSPKPYMGIKLRFGGTEALSAEMISEVLAAIGNQGIPFKATAGLHHPLVEAERYANSFGFLGAVLAVFLLANGAKLSSDQIKQMITIEQTSAFNFSEQGLSFQGYELSSAELIKLKQQQAIAIGSCSLSEPDADLKRLFEK